MKSYPERNQPKKTIGAMCAKGAHRHCYVLSCRCACHAEVKK